MPLNPRNTRVFHRTLFSQQMKTVFLLKRGDDQNQGTVTQYKLFNCRRGKIFKTGEPHQGDMVSDHMCTWHIPRVELDRVGVRYLNALDRLVEITDDWGNRLDQSEYRYWHPEATTNIDVKLFMNHIDLQCLRVDPPAG
jgi:hypothetical protein